MIDDTCNIFEFTRAEVIAFSLVHPTLLNLFEEKMRFVFHKLSLRPRVGSSDIVHRPSNFKTQHRPPLPLHNFSTSINVDMMGQDRHRDPRDDIIASLRTQLRLQEQRENRNVKNHVDLLPCINDLSPEDRHASVPLAIQHQYQIVESQVETRRAELRLLDWQIETRSAQYEQLQQRYRELSSTMKSFRADSVSRHDTPRIQGHLEATAPPEAIAQGPSRDSAIHPAPATPKADSPEAPSDL